MLKQRYKQTFTGKRATYRKKQRNYAPKRNMQMSIRARAGEKKLLDTDINTSQMLSTTGTNGGVNCVNLIRSGNGYYNRIGRKVFLKSLRVYGSFTATYTQPADGDNDGSVVRMVVVFDKQPNGGSLPTFDTMFGHTTQDGTESTNVLDPIKPDNFGRSSRRLWIDMVIKFILKEDL
nr:putative capsid protein [Fiddler Crab associated circular virus]